MALRIAIVQSDLPSPTAPNSVITNSWAANFGGRMRSRISVTWDHCDAGSALTFVEAAGVLARNPTCRSNWMWITKYLTADFDDCPFIALANLLRYPGLLTLVLSI